MEIIDFFNGNKIRTFSDEEKLEILEEIFEGKVPVYMWYSLGNNSSVSAIPRLALLTGARNFGSLEVHKSEVVEGYSLRVRGALSLYPSLDIEGRTAELYLAHSDNPGLSGLKDRRVSFAKGFIHAPESKREYVRSKGLKFDINQIE